ncbi:MAG: hypothetical protein GX339_07140 [Tissierellia bacterium]|nr:hypothetical protein [Tissierellia bacterium]
MIKRYISIFCIIVSIVLMATPLGIAMTFAPGPTERITSYFSYFDLIVIGYGNCFPLMTALLSFVILFILVKRIRKPSMGKVVEICVTICIIFSLLSWIIFNTFTIIGACVASFHLIVLIFLKHQHASNKIQSRD